MRVVGFLLIIYFFVRDICKAAKVELYTDYKLKQSDIHDLVFSTFLRLGITNESSYQNPVVGNASIEGLKMNFKKTILIK